MPFHKVAKCSEINTAMFLASEIFMKHIEAINDKITVQTIGYVVKKCHNVMTMPAISGEQRLGPLSLRQLLQRWPRELHLNWDMSNKDAISTFTRSISVSRLNQLDHVTLKVTSDVLFEMTQVTLGYLNITNLIIDAEGCSLDIILTGLRCRNWDVKNLYLRGNITNLGVMMMYSPMITDSITIINTTDLFHCCSEGTDQGLQYLLNADIQEVSLCNVIRFCCYPPSSCSIVELFLHSVSSSYFIPVNTEWKVDRLQIDMIRCLVEHGIKVKCGAFKSEMTYINCIQKKFPDMIEITSIL